MSPTKPKVGRPSKKKKLSSSERGRQWRNPEDEDLARKRREQDAQRKRMER